MIGLNGQASGVHPSIVRIGRELEAERASGGEVALAELARHFVQADPGSAGAYRYCVAAAREATRRLAYEEAVHQWEGALTAATGQAGQSVLGAPGAAVRIETLIELGEALHGGWRRPRSACTRSGAACGGRPTRS